MSRRVIIRTLVVVAAWTALLAIVTAGSPGSSWGLGTENWSTYGWPSGWIEINREVDREKVVTKSLKVLWKNVPGVGVVWLTIAVFLTASVCGGEKALKKIRSTRSNANNKP
jgi:hypothetical protein